MQRRRYSNRAAARSAVRNATVRRSLARGRVPGNVAGVERRGDGERQGLEIKKCKFARVFMATISLMVVCCEIFSIEEIGVNGGVRALRLTDGAGFVADF